MTKELAHVEGCWSPNYSQVCVFALIFYTRKPLDDINELTQP